MKWVWFHILWMIPMIAVLMGMRGASSKVIRVPLADTSSQRTILCNEKVPQRVRVSVGRVTVINFPFNPKDVVPGEVSFDFKKIKNDLVIKAMRLQAKTNLIVYLEDRRCVFDLVAVSHGGDDILVVTDPKDAQIEVPFHE